MRIYGYSNNATEELLELNEITVSASPEVLREISAFLEQCAKGIENNSEEWNHEHFESKHESADNNPQFIVFNPSAN